MPLCHPRPDEKGQTMNDTSDMEKRDAALRDKVRETNRRSAGSRT